MDPVINFFLSLLENSSELIRPYLSEVGLSLVATLLVIYGNTITTQIKRQIGSLAYLLRLTLFVLFCALGFAFITSFLTPLAISWLAEASDTWLAVIVLVAYYAVGVLAQRKGLI